MNRSERNRVLSLFSVVNRLLRRAINLLAKHENTQELIDIIAQLRRHQTELFNISSAYPGFQRGAGIILDRLLEVISDYDKEFPSSSSLHHDIDNNNNNNHFSENDPSISIPSKSAPTPPPQPPTVIVRPNTIQNKINNLIRDIEQLEHNLTSLSHRGYTFSALYPNSMIFNPENQNEVFLSDQNTFVLNNFRQLVQQLYQFGGGLGGVFNNISAMPQNNLSARQQKHFQMLLRLLLAHFSLSKTDFVYDFRQFSNGDLRKTRYHQEFLTRLFTLFAGVPINVTKQGFFVLQVNFSMDVGDDETENMNKFYYIHPHSITHMLLGILKTLRSLTSMHVTTPDDAASDPVSVLRNVRRLRFVRFMPMTEFLDGQARNTERGLNLGDITPEPLLENWNFVLDGKVTNITSLSGARLLDMYIQKSLIPEIKFKIRNDQAQLLDAAGVQHFDQEDLRANRNYHIGGFFPYYHTTDLDLTRYQIPSSHGDFIEHKSIYDRSCLLYALEQSGQFTEAEIEDISQVCYGRVIPIKKLIDATQAYNFAINLRKTYIAEKHKTKVFNIGPTTATRIINLGLIEGHFFLIDKRIQVTKYYLQHFDEIQEYLAKNRPDLLNTEKKWRIHVLANGRGSIVFAPENSDKIANSFKIITTLIETKRLKCIPMSDVISLDMILYRDINIGKSHEYLGDLDYNDNQSLQSFEKYNTVVKPKAVSKNAATSEKNKTGSVLVFYADFETFTVDNAGNPLDKHIPFMCCATYQGSNRIEVFNGNDCGEQFLKYIVRILRYNEKYKNWCPLVYFHNLGYDIHFLVKYGIINSMQRGRKMLSTEICYKNMIITFKDSASLLPMKLSSFGSVFGLKVHKELFPYKYYTPKRYYENGGLGDIEDCLRIMGWEKGQNYYQFMSNIREVENFVEDSDIELFDMQRYAEFYCKKDVEVLKAGVEMFTESIQKDFGIDAKQYLSISSIADAIFNKEVYSKIPNLYRVGGIVREFLSYAVHGGRVMPAENKKWAYKLSQPEIKAGYGLCDFDAVSLYPSAMSRLWLVDGKPEVFTYDELRDNKFVKNPHYTAYVVEIIITAIPVKRQFPLVIGKNFETGSVLNTNDPPVRMTVCDIELEDLIEFQKIEFTTLRGYYWTGQKHFEIQDCIKKIFEKRAQYKKEGNPIQNVYKLIMNSIYGKTILKPHMTKFTYIKQDDDRLRRLINYHSSEIQYIKQIDESDILAIKRTKPIGLHFNFSLFGIHILAMSKRIMNEVMCLAEDLGMKIYYQDTDSMHIENYNLKMLAERFRQKYGRDLIGTNLGQFHSDFDLTPTSSNVRSIEAYFIGKKCYVDRLIDDEGNKGYHIRLKGVPNNAILDLAQREFNGDVLALYKQLAIGATLKFNLLAGDAVKFEYSKSMTVKNKDKFERNVGFTKTLPPENYENGGFIYTSIIDGELFEERVKRKV